MKTVLIIDDDRKLGKLFTEYLAKFGLKGVPAVHPDNAIRFLRRDYSVPIIMLTARGEVADRLLGLKLGADDYLPKPFEPRERVACIQSVLRRFSIDRMRAGHGWFLALLILKLSIVLPTAFFCIRRLLSLKESIHDDLGKMITMISEILELPRLFEPFYRVDRSRSRETGGYGLGFILCQRIMEAHGGSISINSRQGEGTEVTLVFRPGPG